MSPTIGDVDLSVPIAGFVRKGLLASTELTDSYRARASGAGKRSVALRVLRLENIAVDGRAGATERFLMAAKAGKAAAVGGAAHIVDFGTSQAGPYIATELVPGIDLAGLLHFSHKRAQARGGLDPDLVGVIGAEIALVLAAAHAGIMPLPHLGLSPGNVRITPEARVMVLDFGIAAALRPLAQPFRPSWSFLPPELVRAIGMAAPFQGSTQAADVYSVGALLFYLATGRLPFEAGSIDQLIERAFQPLPSLPLPDRLARTIRALMAPDPRQRPPSMREVADILSEGCESAGERQHRLAVALKALRIEWRKKAKVSGRAERIALSARERPSDAGVPSRPTGRGLRWSALLAGGCIVAAAVIWLLSRPSAEPPAAATAKTATAAVAAGPGEPPPAAVGIAPEDRIAQPGIDAGTPKGPMP